MVWDYIWKAILIVLEGTVLFRVAGRKAISQMTLGETVIMIAIGTFTTLLLEEAFIHLAHLTRK